MRLSTTARDRVRRAALTVVLAASWQPVLAAGPPGRGSGGAAGPLVATAGPVAALGGGERRAWDGRPPGSPRPRLLAGPAGAALSRPAAGTPEEIARRFVEARLAPAGDVVLLGTSAGGGGVRFVRFEQRFGGVRVHLGHVDVAVAPDGRVLAARVGELAPAGPPPRRPRALVGSESAARDAARRALGHAGDPRWADVHVEPVLVATAEGAEPSWRVAFVDAERPERSAMVLVTRSAGRPLRVVPTTFPAVAAARVFPLDPDRPTRWVEFPDPLLRPSVDSPAGWCPGDETLGNNVRAYLDRAAAFDPPSGTAALATGEPPVLDFTFTGDPSADGDLAVSNVFWALNDAHDRFRALGFDEASGAMQADNFGRGGAGGDSVLALVQYGSIDGTVTNDTVQLGTAADGSYTWMTVGVFQADSGPRDAALETDLLYHEYAHGVSIRLVGNDAACLVGVQPQAISEGWSDFFAAAFTNDPVIGAWVTERPDRGLRQRSLEDNAFTLFNLCADGCNRFEDGEIWSGAMWDLRRRLLTRHGVAGATIAERLVVEAMRYTPCQPTFLEARDALIVADHALHGGQHHCDVWAALAQRGMGASATTTGPADEAPLAMFDLPAECTGGVAVAFDRPEYGLDDAAVLEVVDAALATTSVVVTATSGDVETVALVPAGGGPLLTGALPILAGLPSPGDGVLQVEEGDDLTASGPGTEARARVSGTIPLVVLRHEVWGDCPPWPEPDDDHPPGWYVLPGFLDAGEQATVIVTLGHAGVADLVDAEVRVTSLNPSVRVLPTAPIALGAVGAQAGTTPRAVPVEIIAEASPTVVAGEQAILRFDVAARGRSGSVELPLILNMDYVIEEAASPFDGGVETFDPGSSTAALWTHGPARGAADLWSLESCAGRDGLWGAQNGTAGCGPYADGQVAATLVSPGLFPLPADAVAIRILDLSWDNLVALWTDPANPYCDADMVAVFATTDPSSLPYDTPLEVFEHGPQRVWLFTENTGLHVPDGPYGVNRQPQLVPPGFPGDEYRLVWVFWGDIIDCGFETANTGYYQLDNVRFSHDVARAVPESAPCALDCALRTELEIDPPGPKCPGEPFTLRAVGTETSGCAGGVWYAFSGTGVPPEFGWTRDSEAPAVGDPGAVHAVYAQCDTDPACDDYRALVVPGPPQPGIGGPAPGSLRVRRDGDDLAFAWTGAAVPPTYGIHVARTRDDLVAGLATWPLLAAVEGEGPRGEGAHADAGGAVRRGTEFFRVVGREPCTDAPRLP